MTLVTALVFYDCELQVFSEHAIIKFTIKMTSVSMIYSTSNLQKFAPEYALTYFPTRSIPVHFEAEIFNTLHSAYLFF